MTYLRYKYIMLAALSCNQVVYDQIYEALLKETIETQDFNKKNDVIETLRTLCNNQRFSLERGNNDYGINSDRRVVRDFNRGATK